MWLNSKTNTDRDLAGVHSYPSNRFVYAIAKRGCFRSIGVVKDANKFVPTQSGNNVVFSAGLFKHIGDRTDHLVANVMTVSVIDGLETINIQHDEGHRHGTSIRIQKYTFCRYFEVSSV